MIGRPIIRLDSVSSTQDLAFGLGDRGAPEGTVVLARHQRAGRGRAGRMWIAHPGDALMFSILLRPPVRPDRLAPFSVLIADAIAETIGGLYGLDSQVKWPNDVLIGGRKLSGVLIQARAGMAVVGIGVNVRAMAGDLPEGATSLMLETGSGQDVDRLLHSLLPAIDARYADVLAGKTEDAIRRVNERLFLRGQNAVISDGMRERQGRLLRVRPDGALLLDTGGAVEVVVSGELVRGPRPSGR
jgi:BirA family transcriptional regulator, biotin operon repressor / biotin---[acetyl-CoA-carboxylase] ligase